VSIFEGEGNNAQGRKGDGGESGRDNVTDKRVNIKLASADIQYKFIEVGFIRYWGDDTQVETYDLGVIDNLFTIEEALDGIYITGRETVKDITLSELTVGANRDLTCKTQTVVDNRYFGANYTNRIYHDDRLQELAKRIVPHSEIEHTINVNDGYKKFDNILKFIGYFREEIYSFGIVFVWRGGIESDVYPVAGIDDFNMDGELLDHDGFFRFPSHVKSPITNTSATNLNILSVGFSFESTNNNEAEKASDYISSNSDWFQENILGYYFVRSDRHKNMLYQGLNMYGCRAYRENGDESSKCIGVFDGIQEQASESTTLFDSQRNPSVRRGDDQASNYPPGNMAHGCSSISYLLKASSK